MSENELQKQIAFNKTFRKDYKKPTKYPVPLNEQKVQVWGMVNRKHFKVAQKAVKELIEQWR